MDNQRITKARESPSQVRHPRRAAIRTAIAAVIGFLPLLPEIVKAFGLESLPWVAGIIATATAVTRVISSPPAQEWLKNYAPWLLPEPPTPPKHRKEK